MLSVPKILSNSAIYTGVTILQRCVSFFLLPLYTSYLTPSDYGITGVVASVSSFLAIFTTLGLDSAARRFYFKHDGEKEYEKRLFGTISIVIILNSLLFGGLFIGLHRWVIDPLLGEIPFYPYVLIGLLNVLVTPLYLLFQGYLQTIQNGKEYGINAMLNFLLQVVLTIVLVVGLKMGALGVLLASLLTAIAFFVYTIITFIKYQRLVIDKGILKESYRYSLPLLPHTLANWSNSTIDKLLVNGIRTEADAGLYNIGSQYNSVFNTLSIAINSAYVPWFFEREKNISETLPSIKKMSEMITFLVCFIAIGMSLFAQEILGIMITNPAYEGVWKVVPFLICGIIFNTIYYYYANVLFLNKTGVIFFITVSTIFINVAFNIWLIPIWGVVGCGIASLVTFFAKSVLSVGVSMYFNRIIRFRTLYLYSIGIISSLICLSSFLFVNQSFYLAIIEKLLIVGGCGLFVFLKYKRDILDIFKFSKTNK